MPSDVDELDRLIDGCYEVVLFLYIHIFIYRSLIGVFYEEGVLTPFARVYLLEVVEFLVPFLFDLPVHREHTEESNDCRQQ